MRLYTLDWVDRSAHVGDGKCGGTDVLMHGVCERGVKHCKVVSGFEFRYWVMLRAEADIRELSGMLRHVPNVSMRPDGEFASVEVERFRGTEQLFARLTSTCAECLRLSYATLRGMTWDGDAPVRTFEGSVTPVSRFLQVLDIAPHAWVNVPLHAEIAFTDIFATADQTLPRELCVAAFDIECLSDDCVSFPDAGNERDTVEQIGLVLVRPFADVPAVRYMFTLQDVEADMVVVKCATECEMWARFREVVDESVHILTSYNGFGFDFPYLIARCAVTEPVVRKEFKTAAFGCQSFTYVEFAGVLQLDMLVYMRKEKKLESYKLDDVAATFLGASKHDVSPRQIFEALKHGDGADRRRIAEYCIQDCLLVVQLMDKFQALKGYIAMCNVTSCPFKKLVITGQQARTLDMLSRVLLAKRLLMPDRPRDIREAGEVYTGATVLEARSGLYTDPVAGLDFASLYPSIMIANNLCVSTRHPGVPERLGDYHDIDGTYYRKEPAGVIPQVLQYLWSTRKATRAKMKHTTDADALNTLQAQQLSYKLVMNSLYGTLGSSYFPIESQTIAKGVTWFGRELLHRTQELIKGKYGDACEIVYGDSVTGDTLVETEHGAVAIAELAGRWRRYVHVDKAQQRLGRLHGKQVAAPTHRVRVATSDGLQRLQYLIRRRHEGPLYVVHLSDGTRLRVTGDHAIWHNHGWRSAKELRVGMAL